jgi:hypothetical protein
VLLGAWAARSAAEPAPENTTEHAPAKVTEHATITDGARTLAFAPVLVVAESAQPKRAAEQRVPFKWTQEPERASAESPDGALAVTLALDRPDDGAGAVLAISAEWKRRTWLHVAAVEFELPGERVQVIGRDLKPAPARTAFLERFDPKWIALQDPAITVVADDGLDAVEVHAAHGHTTVRLALDSADARPFLHDARCNKLWRAPNRHLPAPLRVRDEHDRVVARVQLVLGRPTPLAQARFPDGRRAALAISDHADQSSARTLAVLARGLVDHHVSITKALFAHGADRPQLESPEVEKIADELAAAGDEIVPHSATPRPDDRATTTAALDRFDRWHARTWIDHQPETNCEAFGDQGWLVEGKFAIADLLAAHHYQYVWAEDDAQPGDLNLLEPKRLDHRAPTVWPLGRLEASGPDGLWMFRSMWAFIEARRFYRMYAEDRLDALERERGLHVAHTYLETYHPRRTRFGLRNLLVPADKKHKPGDPGAVALDPRFDALLASLEKRQARGSLWVPTIGELGDRLRATSELTITLAADGGYVVHAPRAIAGATFVVPVAAAVEIAGKAPRGIRVEGHETTFWDDFSEGDTIVRVTPR